VVDGANGSKLGQRMLARIGVRRAGRVEVLDGLKPGDLVAVAGQGRLMRGEPQPVRIVQLGDKPGDKPGDKAAAERPGPRPSGASTAASGTTPGRAASAAPAGERSALAPQRVATNTAP
jgi:membrane fusion protein (multidrug efflux system)